MRYTRFCIGKIIFPSEVVEIFAKRTDLAMEAHELWRAQANGKELRGVESTQRERCGYAVTAVRVTDEEAGRALGKPEGTYLTLDLRSYRPHEADALERAANAVGKELRTLLPENVRRALVVGLGNCDMTPDAIGPRAAKHVLVTRHLMQAPAFSSLTSVSVLVPGVLGSTGMEAVELIRGAVRAAEPEVLIAVDALASRSLSRVCSTVQLSDTGIIPGSGVGNRRRALNKASLRIPVLAVGVPTVVDAATLAADLLEEAGYSEIDPAALRGRDAASLMVTPRDIDAQVTELAHIVGLGINLALQPLSCKELTALTE